MAGPLGPRSSSGRRGRARSAEPSRKGRLTTRLGANSRPSSVLRTRKRPLAGGARRAGRDRVPREHQLERRAGLRPPRRASGTPGSGFSAGPVGLDGGRGGTRAGNIRATRTFTLLVPAFDAGDGVELLDRASYTNVKVDRTSKREPLVQHRDPFPTHGRMEAEVAKAYWLDKVVWPRSKTRTSTGSPPARRRMSQPAVTRIPCPMEVPQASAAFIRRRRPRPSPRS